MLTLEAKMKKVENVMSDSKFISGAMPAYMDLRNFESINDLTESLSNECESQMFYKFCCAAAVSLVSDKAAQFEKEHFSA